MKKTGFVLVTALILASCEINTTGAKSEVDSAVSKFDSTVENLGDKAENVWDSTKAKAKDVKEGIDSTLDKKF